MIRTLSLVSLTCLSLCVTAQAQVDEDELVRLPGQGEIRSEGLRQKAKATRLKPGAGLLITFDTNDDERISPAEIETGIPIAFASADKNQDGYLTALEQQDWAASLPTRDDSLANPFRFDPNLDRRADLEEFTSVISNLASDYASEDNTDILVSDLKAPRPRAQDRRNGIEEAIQEQRRDRPANRRNQSARN